jgi:hypothetical protein
MAARPAMEKRWARLADGSPGTRRTQRERLAFVGSLGWQAYLKRMRSRFSKENAGSGEGLLSAAGPLGSDEPT